MLLLEVKKIKAEEVSKTLKKKIIVEKSESESGTMADIDNYQDSSV